ncbi:MAG: beta-hydroxyacyl-ACP dehydratase [Planctomycetes bacterium]|nr:beta-hydroxyacyl-ACP dehydratase [Planctomycetota bacterium]
MVAPLIFDISKLDLNNLLLDKAKIRQIIPHRYEMEQLDGILYFDKPSQIIVGFKDVKADEFWVRGHIPGRPLLPGVLMLEAAAQLSSIQCKMLGTQEGDKFIGFGGVDKVRFRGTVVPGDKLIIISKCTSLKSRSAMFDVQGVVNGKLVLEAVIIGILI